MRRHRRQWHGDQSDKFNRLKIRDRSGADTLCTHLCHIYVYNFVYT